MLFAGHRGTCHSICITCGQKASQILPRLLIEMKNRKGQIETVLIEVKPFKQTQVPQKPKRMTKTFENATKTFLVNQAKWDAAKIVCENKGWEFKILTEKEIYGKR